MQTFTGSPELEALAEISRPAPRFLAGDRVVDNRYGAAPGLPWVVTEVRWCGDRWRVTAGACGMTAVANQNTWRRATPADEAWRPEPMSQRQRHEARYDGRLPPYPREAEGEAV